MALELQDDETEVGRIEIAVILPSDGGPMRVGYGVEDITDDAAMGYLVKVLDRMRDVARYRWGTTAEEEADEL